MINYVFANDVVLINETRNGVNSKLDVWRQTLDFNRLRLSMIKMQKLIVIYSFIAK